MTECRVSLSLDHARECAAWGSEYRVKWDIGQLADLEKGRLYVQLHSEKAPDGNLWGWLMPQENKR